MKKSTLLAITATVLVLLMTYMPANAQYVVSDKYDLWFEDTDNEMTTRKAEWCTEDYQDLRNGCYVRINSSYVYIYNNGRSILYGDEINLIYNGYYRVKRNGTWYLADPDGDLVDGIYGKEIIYYPWNHVAVQRSSGYWDVYNCNGYKLDFYSDESPLIFANGCWGVKHGRYWYGYDQDGDQISGVYGDELILLNDGRWKCIQGSYISYVRP